MNGVGEHHVIAKGSASSQIAVSNYHFPLKGTRFHGKLAGSKRQGNDMLSLKVLVPERTGLVRTGQSEWASTHQIVTADHHEVKEMGNRSLC